MKTQRKVNFLSNQVYISSTDYIHSLCQMLFEASKESPQIQKNECKENAKETAA